MRLAASLLLIFFINASRASGFDVIQSGADTVKARLHLEEAKKNFAKPSLADSLGLLAFQQAGNNIPLRAESAYVICFANAPGDFERAQQWGDTAIYNYKQLQNNLWIGYTLRTLGVQAKKTNKHDLSIRYLQESIGYFEKSKDTVMMAQNYVTLSLLYHNNLMEYKKGLEYGLKGLRLLESQHTSQPVLYWRAINTIAINYDDAGDWDNALRFHERNLSFEDPYYKSSTLNNIGNTLKKKGELKRAAEFFQQSLAITASGETYDLATVYCNLSQVNYDLGNIKMAYFYNDSSLHYAIKSNDSEKLRDSYEFAYKLHQREGNYRKAFEYLNAYTVIKDSVLNKDKAQIIYELESRFQSEQKERKIAQLQNETLIKDLEIQQSRFIIWGVVGAVGLLVLVIFWYYKRQQYKQNVERAQEREELQRQRFSAVIEAEETERSRVAKDLHDGLGQLLSTAKLGLTAVSLPQHDAQTHLLANSINALDQATQEVRSISHNLMPATLTELGLKSALDDMFHKINDSKLMNIKLRMDGLDTRLPGTVEVAVYRVIQEVINNMIKHSKADLIQVNLLRTGNSLRLSIADNGVGFEKEMITRSKGLGWKNIFSRIAMLNGNIEVETQPGAGTNINIQFAIA
ncbi:MAG: sensor histidine kinase [Cyclobacteriaceae bacterium]